MKILVVDDEPDVAALIGMGIHFHRPDHQVIEVHDGEAAVEAVDREHPDVVVLDLAMPGKDGFAVLRELRDKGDDVPIIVLTAKALEGDRVKGLELGADDYVTKPFSQKELVARIDAVLRRQRAAMSHRRANVFQHRELRIDFAQRRVQVGERVVSLTPTEYNLLYHLVTNAGRLMPHETLLAKVWGHEYRDEVHYLKVYVGRLRSKLERDPQQPEYILTVRGVGYQFPSVEPATSGALTDN